MSFKKLFFCFSLVANLSVWANCEYTFDKGIDIKWQATKTKKEVPVTGTFKSVEINSSKANTVEALLKNSSISINGTSVNSGNEVRDGKLSGIFFKAFLNNSKITGKVKATTNKTVDIEISMNEVSKTVQFNYEVNSESVLMAEANFLFSEFSLDSQYEAISKACSLLHEGVMGKSVKVMIEAKINKSCK